jgi:hypothetical protein
VAADVPLEAAVRAAAAIEARAYAYVCRAAEAGSSLDSFARVYAKEASALLLAEVDEHTRWAPCGQPTPLLLHPRCQ